MLKLFQKKSEFDILWRKLNDLQKTIDTISDDMENDRRNNDQVLIHQGTIIDHLQAIRDLWATQTKKIKETVADEIEIVAEKVSEMSEILTTPFENESPKS